MMIVGSLGNVIVNESRYVKGALDTAKKTQFGGIVGGTLAGGYEAYKALKDPFSIDPVASATNINRGVNAGLAVGAGKGLYDAYKSNSGDLWNKNDSTVEKVKKGAKYAAKTGFEMLGQRGGSLIGGIAGGTGGAVISAGNPIVTPMGAVAGAIGGSHLGGKAGRALGDYVFGKDKKSNKKKK